MAERLAEMERKHRRDPGQDWTEPTHSAEPSVAPETLDEAADVVLAGIPGSEVLGSYHRTGDGEWLDIRTGEIHSEIPNLGTTDDTPRHHISNLHKRAENP